MPFLPPRSINRHPAHSIVWAGKWKLYIIPIIMAGLMLQVLFLSNMSYMYGSLFKSGSRMHNLKVLAVDFDGRDVGRALSESYSHLKSAEFPTVEFAAPAEYPTPDSLREAVCKHGYWAAVYTSPDATDRVLAAIEGDNTTYESSHAMTYIYNSIYYPSAFSSLRGSLQALVSVASNIFPFVSPDAMAAVNMTNPVSAAAFLNPIDATVWDIMPTSQGSRVLLNTVSMVMPIIMQFFFIMGLNGITTNAKVLDTQSKRDVYTFRLFASRIYGCVSALCMAGYIWAFRESWDVTAGQFFETWLCLWLYMDINYVVIDTLIGTLIPIAFFPYFLLSWIILNITAVIFPFQLNAGFYHWGRALPAHSVWLLLVSIWSHGCRGQLDVTFPILFAWWLVGQFTSAWSVRKRCLMAEAEAQHETRDHNEFSREKTQQSQHSFLEGISSRASGQVLKSQSSDNLEANLVGEALPDHSDSRTVVNAVLFSHKDDEAMGQRE
jgi:hypothetical protein